MVSFDDLDEQNKEKKITILTQDITLNFRKVEQELKNIVLEGGLPKTSSEESVRLNVQKSLARKLQGLSTNFRTVQKDFLNRLKKQKEGGCDDFDFLDDKHENSQIGGASKLKLINQSQLAVLEESESYVLERDSEIRSIAKSINELTDIFKELAILVIDQGTVLDRIDYNMEQVVERTKGGVEQLVMAEEYQKSAVPTKIIIVLFVLIFVMVLILILKHTKF